MSPSAYMRDIDKIVWQLDVGDLDKPFDINDREVRNLARVGPAARPKQSPIRKLNPTTFIIPTKTPQAIDIEYDSRVRPFSEQGVYKRQGQGSFRTYCVG